MLGQPGPEDRLRPVYLVALLALAGCTPEGGHDTGVVPRSQWTEEQAWAWHEAQPWLVGFNYAPRTASNQLEMWQDATWDPDTIDQELGWAAELGFNTARVFLHDLLWEADPDACLERIDTFLGIADSHGIGVMLVLFDGVWDPEPVAGEQPEPIPWVHNSRWVQSPGAAILGDDSRHAALEPYVRGVVARFRDDPRVVAWDLFNEPDNLNLTAYGDTELDYAIKTEQALDLLTLAMGWAREEDPLQPLTAGVFMGSWSDPGALNRFMLEQSDVVSFHSYEPAAQVEGAVETLRAWGRPLLCTEYMARPEGSTFAQILPIWQREEVHAWSWGLVSGRTQTIYPWSSWTDPQEGEPDPWFHDVLRADGTPFDEEEAELLRGML